MEEHHNMSQDSTASSPETAQELHRSYTGTAAEIKDCQAQILRCLESGEKRRKQILEAVDGSEGHIDKRLNSLVDQGKILKVGRGVYQLNTDLLMRFDRQNAYTINRLLNLYDMVLDEYAVLIEKMFKSDKPLEEKAKLLTNFKSLASMADTLMKRWYLVHRGYDNNSRQAQEDAKMKTRQAEKEALAKAPLEEQIEVVGHFKEGMIEILRTLPQEETEKRSV